MVVRSMVFSHQQPTPYYVRQGTTCLNARNRRNLYEAAGTSQYRELMSTGKDLRAVARWVMSEGPLSLTKEQINHVEGRSKRTR